jgi:hypothetical protein
VVGQTRCSTLHGENHHSDDRGDGIAAAAGSAGAAATLSAPSATSAPRRARMGIPRGTGDRTARRFTGLWHRRK